MGIHNSLDGTEWHLTESASAGTYESQHVNYDGTVVKEFMERQRLSAMNAF